MGTVKTFGLTTATAKRNWSPGCLVQEAAGKVKKVYGYFNNHYHGYAPENCLQLLERLGLLSEEQKKAKAKTVVKQSQLGYFFS
jgi:hypothetical protein